MFQFPSNGKAYPKPSLGLTEAIGLLIVVSVSIPFKRESVSKVATKFARPPKKPSSFNSLQTGKRIQRASVGGAVAAAEECFNSLQTGKRIQRFSPLDWIGVEDMCFNSLQTGKRIQRASLPVAMILGHFVSIPFKRESVSKVMTTLISVLTKQVSIPFKRESVSKASSGSGSKGSSSGFNSLQTGKRIQRCTTSGNSGGIASFNSLQTGKRIQSSLLILFLVLLAIVSIPFKRESVSKACWSM